MAKITLGDIQIEVIRKRIKHVHLSVHPPAGRVRISAPNHIDLEIIRSYAFSKLGWIEKQRAKMKSQEREPRREYLDGESHYYLGKPYVMKHIARQTASGVRIHANVMEVRMRGSSSPLKAKSVLRSWYRARLREIVRACVRKWEPVLGVKARELGIKIMKTRWGTCNPRAKRIWLNLELIKKPMKYIEYVTVHELAHLLERNHGPGFKRLMDRHVPDWKQYRRDLNRTSLR